MKTIKQIYKVGEYIVVRMKGHCRYDQIGRVEMVISSPDDLPDAVLVRLPGIDDWFFGENCNIQHAHWG